jgi:hypothetical protein
MDAKTDTTFPDLSDLEREGGSAGLGAGHIIEQRRPEIERLAQGLRLLEDF